MGKITIQKAIIKVIQPAIVEFYCDECGRKLDTNTNPKTHYYSQGKTLYVCRYNPKCNTFYRQPKSGKWVNYVPPAPTGGKLDEN